MGFSIDVVEAVIHEKKRVGLPGPQDSSGTAGAATINAPTGKSAIASGATSVVITNSLVGPNTKVNLSINQAAEDATATRLRYTATTGSFTVFANAAATGNLVFSWDLYE